MRQISEHFGTKRVNYNILSLKVDKIKDACILIFYNLQKKLISIYLFYIEVY